MIFESLDTETIDGLVKILATPEKHYFINNFDEIIDIIFNPEYEKTIFTTYNLRYDMQAILKLLFIENENDWTDIAKQILKNEYKYQNKYHIHYIPNKMLKIKSGKNSKLIYDIAQFYEWNKLDNMAKMYLNKSKQDTVNWTDKSKEYTEGLISLKELEDYYENNKNAIAEYCKYDAYLTRELTYFMQNTFQELKFPFDNPLSMAKLAEIFITKKYLYPQVSKKMEKTHNFVKQSFHGGIFQSLQRGHLKHDIYEYDINSAYPYQLSKLDHLANGILQKVDKPSHKADMGWYLCVFDSSWIPYKKDIPYFIEIYFSDNESILFPLSDRSTFYCTGLRKQIITKLEYDFLKKYTKVKNYGGIEWYKTKDTYVSPFEWIPTAYEKRKKFKDINPDDIRQKTLKRMYNSVYGKTAQQKHGYSRLTNFFYSSYCTAGCRVMISEIAINNPNIVIEIATDGIYTTDEINYLPVSNELGEYEFKHYETGLFIGSGMKQLWKNNNDYITKMRGITEDRSFNLINKLKKNLTKQEILFWKYRPIQLNECIIQIHKRSLSDLNKFSPVGRKLNVNTDKKHHWSKEYKDFRDFLKHPSKAEYFNINEVDNLYNNYIKDEGT